MKKLPKNFVHHKVIDEASLEVTMLDNITDAILELNATLIEIKNLITQEA